MVLEQEYGDVRGIAHLEAGVPRYTGRRPPVNLDLAPPFSVRYRRFGPMEVTRGCPWSCRYCQTPHLFGSVRRHRSVETVLRYAELGKGKGLRDLRFVTPDAFSYGSDGKQPNLEALERLLKAVSEIYGKEHVYLGSFPSEVRPDMAGEEAVKLVATYAANDNLVIGAQSGSERMLDLMHRGHGVEDVYRAVRIVTRAGFLANVDVIFGLPGETAEDLRLTLRMMDDLTALGARIHSHTFMPLAGTPLAAAPRGRSIARQGGLWNGLRARGGSSARGPGKKGLGKSLPGFGQGGGPNSHPRTGLEPEAG